MERELERNATLYLPPRTFPVQAFPTPILSHSPAPSTRELTPPSPRLPGVSLPPTTRRSNSPASSVASLNPISTLSSTRSHPSSSSPSLGTLALHSRRSSTRPYGSRRFQAGSRSGGDSTGTIEAPEAPTITPTTPIATTTDNHSTSRNNSNASLSVTTAVPLGILGYGYPSEMSTDELVATCLAFLERLRRGSSPIVIQRLNNIGPVPEDKAVLSFWIAQVSVFPFSLCGVCSPFYGHVPDLFPPPPAFPLR